MAMLVDVYRFPDVTARQQVMARRAAWRDLISERRRKAHDLVRVVKEWPAVLCGYRALADAASRSLFKDILTYRLLTPHFSSIANNKALYNELRDSLERSIERDEPPDIIRHVDPQLSAWKMIYEGHTLKLTSDRYVAWFFRSSQYYFRRDFVFVGPEAGDVILDCGSFLGESALKFLVDSGPSGLIYGFDPLPSHVLIARENSRQNGFEGKSLFCCRRLQRQQR